MTFNIVTLQRKININGHVLPDLELLKYCCDNIHWELIHSFISYNYLMVRLI